MPIEIVLSFDLMFFESLSGILKVSKRLGVSSFALLVRALNLNIISMSAYQEFKVQAVINHEEFLKKKKAKQKLGGGPNYFLLKLNRNGRLFTQTVLNAFREGSIEPALASALLDVKVNKFSEFGL